MLLSVGPRSRGLGNVVPQEVSGMLRNLWWNVLPWDSAWEVVAAAQVVVMKYGLVMAAISLSVSRCLTFRDLGWQQGWSVWSASWGGAS